jgi:hypothetical protein
LVTATGKNLNVMAATGTCPEDFLSLHQYSFNSDAIFSRIDGSTSPGATSPIRTLLDNCQSTAQACALISVILSC